MNKPFEGCWYNRNLDKHTKLYKCYETGVQAFLHLTQQQYKCLDKLAFNTGYSGYNIFIMNFTRLIDYQ